MKFGLASLAGLTIVIAIACSIARIYTSNPGELLLVGMGVAYAFAPLLLALGSSFFQAWSPRQRARGSYVAMVFLAAGTTIFAFSQSMIWGVMVLGYTGALWVIQLEIFGIIHERQEARHYGKLLDERSRRKDDSGRLDDEQRVKRLK